jgi:hypothetical protein
MVFKSFALGRPFVTILFWLLGFSTEVTALTTPTPPKQYFNITAIGTCDRFSLLQCWQLSNPISISTGPGNSGAKQIELGDLANGTYAYLPANYSGETHNAPVVQ